uniref:DDE Tnp4 domain-containing protein n=1 Tax=Tetranychus urticae TaxID=32264 RepID=T1KWR0_TETUR
MASTSSQKNYCVGCSTHHSTSRRKSGNKFRLYPITQLSEAEFFTLNRESLSKKTGRRLAESQINLGNACFQYQQYYQYSLHTENEPIDADLDNELEPQPSISDRDRSRSNSFSSPRTSYVETNYCEDSASESESEDRAISINYEENADQEVFESNESEMEVSSASESEREVAEQSDSNTSNDSESTDSDYEQPPENRPSSPAPNRAEPQRTLSGHTTRVWRCAKCCRSHLEVPNEDQNNFYRHWTGLDHEQFFAFLQDLSFMLHKHPTTVSQNFIRVLKLIVAHFVPLHFGYKYITREEALEHGTRIANALLYVEDGKIVLIADETYCDHQKSSNFPYAQRSHSLHKNRNLFKLFIICLPNGYIVDVVPHTSARDNDAKILENLLNTDPDTQAFLQQGDCWVLDRGFRDVIDLVEEHGFRAFMPRSVEDGRFKIVAEVWHNTSLEHADDIINVCCALMNAFGTRIYSDVGNEEHIITQILRRDKENNLADMILGERFNLQREQWELNDDLYFFAAGTYQLRYVAT